MQFTEHDLLPDWVAEAVTKAAFATPNYVVVRPEPAAAAAPAG